MTIGEHYKKATLYPSIAVIVSTIVFSIIENKDYKSEWLRAESVVFLSITTAVIYCLIISFFSLTIFLIKFQKIKESNVLTFLSWFLFPVALITFVIIHEISFSIKYQEKLTSDFIYTIILNLPFVVGLIWSYYKYKK